MILQENDFLKVYNELGKLWEGIGTTNINGIEVVLKRNFQPPVKLIKDVPKRTSGIYLIKYECPDSGPQYYVGKSVDIAYRTHVHFIKCPAKDSKLLHNKIKAHYKSNPERFSVAILEECSAIDELNKLERYWIAKLNTCHAHNETGGLNLTLGGDGSGTPRVTPEIYNKIIKELKRDPSDPEWKTVTDIAAYVVAPEKALSRKTIYYVNNGQHYLSTGDLEYPLRSEKINKAASLETGRINNEKSQEAAALHHIVYKDANKNYYYFQTSVEAAKWALNNKLYTSEAHYQIKRNISRNNSYFETIEEFINAKKAIWGKLNIVPDLAKANGGFTGNMIKNDKNEEVGIKITHINA